LGLDMNGCEYASNIGPIQLSDSPSKTID